jgi:hypothetical protein
MSHHNNARSPTPNSPPCSPSPPPSQPPHSIGVGLPPSSMVAGSLDSTTAAAATVQAALAALQAGQISINQVSFLFRYTYIIDLY